MTAPTGNAAPEQHAAETPFGRLWRTRDLEAWLEHLSPDVVLHSPITATPFTGIDLARDVYAVLLAVLHDVVVSSPHTGTEGAAHLWHATASGRPVHGCDVLRTGLDGRISEITVYVRPATGVAALAAAMGGPLAALRRPRARRAVAAASAPLPHLAAAIDLSAAFVAGIPRSSRVG